MQTKLTKPVRGNAAQTYLGMGTGITGTLDEASGFSQPKTSLTRSPNSVPEAV
ncbi:hypothetical protein TWF718_002467 [Orbilia javanica]|uniref:Uncharacterized protein n=1 Tax=Orbilia javanica TaxID=47235 RepID=A0AAN8MK57_9PEZI